MLGSIKLALGRMLAAYLNKQVKHYRPFSVHRAATLSRILRPGDILLVEGNARISTAIKYLTQSTWSHAAFHAGPIEGHTGAGGEPCCLVEAELSQGVIATPVSKYRDFNTRICRPMGLSEADRQKIVDFMVSKVGLQYDLKNVIDLARYLVPIPVPSFMRRRMIALGSGDPTRAICSTLVAQAYQSVRYPILPKTRSPDRANSEFTEREILHIRHHSLFTPRDFDLSPYFCVIKPTLEAGFDYRTLEWSEDKP